MKFAFHSIRWRLQIFHTLALATVLAALSVTVWRLENTRRLRSLDADLQRKAQSVMHTLGPRRGPNDLSPAAEAIAYYHVMFGPDKAVLRTSENAPKEIPFPEFPA